MPAPNMEPATIQKSTFGKYRLIAALGHGGMADVFLAVHEGPKGLGFSKLVVIKRLRPNLAEDLEFVQMLVDEAWIAARLNHPNAIQTYEIGQVENQFFIAMEYLDGQPLSRILTRSKRDEIALPQNYAISILADVLAGLHHAHELRDFKGDPLNVVHRDVTPQNVFVTYDGQTKIVDFGIAKAAGRAAQTKEGVMKGKIVYMAPEQAFGHQIDRRADIFATGLMLYEFITGRRAWEGLDELGVMRKLIKGELPPPPREVNPEVDAKLDEICRRSLAIKPADRFETAEEMSNELVAVLTAKNDRPLPKDVGTWVAELFADRRKQTQDAIAAQLAELERKRSGLHVRALPGIDNASTPQSGRYPVATAHAGENTVAVAVAPPSLTGPAVAVESSSLADGGRAIDEEPALVDGDPAAETRHRAPAQSAPTSPSARTVDPQPGSTDVRGEHGRRRSWRVPLALLTIVGVVAGGVVYTRRWRATVPVVMSSQTTVASASAATSPAEPASVVVALTSNVSGAAFQIDKGPRLQSPYHGSFPLDRAAHTITASAPGYEDATFVARFDGDVSWHAEMKRKSGSASVATPTTTSKPRPTSPGTNTNNVTTSSTATVPTATATTTATATATATATSAKPRDIDEDNPYHKKKP